MAMSARALCEQEVNGTGGPAAAALQQGIIAGGKRPGGYQASKRRPSRLRGGGWWEPLTPYTATASSTATDAATSLTVNGEL